MFWPCETRTSTCRSFATISSGLYRFLAITVLLDVKDIPQVGPLQWGWISCDGRDQDRITHHHQLFALTAAVSPGFIENATISACGESPLRPRSRRSQDFHHRHDVEEQSLPGSSHLSLFQANSAGKNDPRS